jgi:hypothetical protein
LPEVLPTPVDAVTDPRAQVIPVALDRTEHRPTNADSIRERPEKNVLAIAKGDPRPVERIAETGEIAFVERDGVLKERRLDRGAFGVSDRRRTNPAVRSSDREDPDQK